MEAGARRGGEPASGRGLWPQAIPAASVSEPHSCGPQEFYQPLAMSLLLYTIESIEKASDDAGATWVDKEGASLIRTLQKASAGEEAGCFPAGQEDRWEDDSEDDSMDGLILGMEDTPLSLTTVLKALIERWHSAGAEMGSPAAESCALAVAHLLPEVLRRVSCIAAANLFRFLVGLKCVQVPCPTCWLQLLFTPVTLAKRVGVQVTLESQACSTL